MKAFQAFKIPIILIIIFGITTLVMTLPARYSFYPLRQLWEACATYFGDGDSTEINRDGNDIYLRDTTHGKKTLAQITLDSEWDTEAEVEAVWGAVNIILESEIDTEAKLEAILAAIDLYSSDDDFTDWVKAYMVDWGLDAGQINASHIQLLHAATSLYDDVQDLVNTSFSAGRISGGTITSDGDGTCTVSAGTGLIKQTNDNLGLTQFINWSANTTLTLIDASMNHIYVAYNGGSPIVGVTTDETEINGRDEFELGHLYRDGNNLHISQHGPNIEDFLFHVNERAHDFGHVRGSGIVISDAGGASRNVNLTAGNIWAELTEISISAQTPATFTTWYHSGGYWASSTGQTVINNTQYDNGTDLATLTANRYGVHWVYIHEDGDMHIVFGMGDYKLSQAQGSTPPALPETVSEIGMLIGRIIIQKNATAFAETATAFVTTFGFTGVIDHAELAGLQGGTTDEYYHSTSAEYTELNEWLDDVILGADGSTTIPNLYLINTNTTAPSTNGQFNYNGNRFEFYQGGAITTTMLLGVAAGDMIYQVYTVEEEFLTTTDDNYPSQALGDDDANGGWNDKVAMSFTTSNARMVKGVQAYFDKLLTPGDITVTIETDSGGHRSGTLAHANLTGTIAEADVTGLAWHRCTFANAGYLPAGTYWAVFSIAGNPGADEFYVFWGDADNTYGGGHYEYHLYGGSWTDGTNIVDMAFKIEYADWGILSVGTDGQAVTSDGTYPQFETIDYAFISGNDAATGITAAELEELSDGSTTDLHAHDYADISGADGATDVTAAELEELTDGSTTTKHAHGYTTLTYENSTDVNSGGNSPTSWTDLSLAGVVGSNEALVTLRFKSTVDLNEVAIRTNGDGNEYYDEAVDANAAGIVIGHQDADVDMVLGPVMTDSAGKVEWITNSSQAANVYVVWYIK